MPNYENLQIQYLPFIAQNNHQKENVFHIFLSCPQKLGSYNNLAQHGKFKQKFFFEITPPYCMSLTESVLSSCSSYDLSSIATASSCLQDNIFMADRVQALFFNNYRYNCTVRPALTCFGLI